MHARNPQDRILVARIAASARWAKEADRKAATLAGRKGLLARFEREVDPDGVLSPSERLYRAEHARRSHMAKLAFAVSAGSPRQGWRCSMSRWLKAYIAAYRDFESATLGRLPAWSWLKSAVLMPGSAGHSTCTSLRNGR